ncbi:hypothetical protein [uncultured Succiniclasticum sp.]|uniref:hypothetical protein n=1 Tax=uncultured Succiniclasticum sp. TaxID=1500547 RepID=UPI0025CE0E24|nr:hypothetical protein [uncultured Succiniclasticum sp.]
MRFDEFDILLSDSRITEVEWKAFAKILKIKDIENKDTQERCLTVNKEFRHYFGNTIINVVRDEYSPDYDIIIQATRGFLGIDEVDFPTDASILVKESLICKKIVGDELINESTYETFIDRIMEVSNAKAETRLTKFINGLKDGLKGGLMGYYRSKSLGYVGIVGGVVNRVLFETNWEIVLSIIMLTCSIRKRLAVLDEFSAISDNE